MSVCELCDNPKEYLSDKLRELTDKLSDKLSKACECDKFNVENICKGDAGESKVLKKKKEIEQKLREARANKNVSKTEYIDLEIGLAKELDDLKSSLSK